MPITTIRDDYNTNVTGSEQPNFSDTNQTKSSTSKSDNAIINQGRVIWFYEDQLQNKTDATVRVYAMPGLSYSNKTSYNTGSNGSFINVPGATQEEIDSEANIGDESKANLVLTGIIKDDFNFNISNNFKQINGDPLSNLVKNIFSSFKGNEKLVSFAKDIFGDTMVGRGLNQVQAAANLGLLSMSDLYRVFEQTDVNIPKFTVETLIYANDTESNALSVKDRLKILLDRVQGRVEDITDSTYGGSETGSDFKDVFGGFFAWQTPPNGYRAKLRRNDPSIGTFFVEYGNLYKITDLIPVDIDITMSKFRLKTKDNDASKVEPLYAGVKLTLEPSIKYLKTELFKFLNMYV